MVFGSSWTFSLLQPPYFHVMNLDWASHAVVHEGDTASLFVPVANPGLGPRRCCARSWSTRTGVETAVAPESLGPRAARVMTSDATRSRCPGSRAAGRACRATDTTTVTRIRVRTADSTAVSAVALRVAPAPDPARPLPPPDPGLAEDHAGSRPSCRARGCPARAARHTARRHGRAGRGAARGGAGARRRLRRARPAGAQPRRARPAGRRHVVLLGRPRPSGALLQRGVYFARLRRGRTRDHHADPAARPLSARDAGGAGIRRGPRATDQRERFSGLSPSSVLARRTGRPCGSARRRTTPRRRRTRGAG